MKIHIHPTDPKGTLDRVMQLHRQPGTEVILHAGEYWTDGAWGAGENWERKQAPGVILRAEGGAVRVSLADDAPRSLDGKPRPERDLRVWTYGHGAGIKGVVFDGRHEAFPENFVTAGVRGVGSSVMQDVFVEGLRGRYPGSGTSGIEAFGISATGQEGGSNWTDCVVRSCAENAYVSSFNVGHVNTKTRSRLKGCEAIQGVGGWMGFGVNEKVDLVDCISRDVVAHVYNDEDVTRDVTVTGGGAVRSQKLLSMVAKPQSPTAKVGVRFVGGDYELIGDAAGEARIVELWDQTGGVTVGNVALTGVRIRSIAAKLYLAAVAGSSGTTHFPVAFSGCNIEAAGIVQPTHTSVITIA